MNAQIYISSSSAKDQLTGSAVAIKKIMKPFSTPVLSKRTYRELKLLKHIQHENVGRLYAIHIILLWQCCLQIISLGDVFISPLEDLWVLLYIKFLQGVINTLNSYFVTELLGTDLHRLLTSRPLEKQFIQYFLYQILVDPISFFSTYFNSSSISVVSNMFIQPESFIVT